MNKNQDKVLKA